MAHAPQPASNAFEDFQRVFSKFASAEEVTGAAPVEDEDAAAEEDEKPVKEEVRIQGIGFWVYRNQAPAEDEEAAAEEDEGLLETRYAFTIKAGCGKGADSAPSGLKNSVLGSFWPAADA